MADTDARLPREKLAAAEAENRHLQKQVDLDPDPPNSPMHDDGNMDTDKHNSDLCGWCTSEWRGGIDSTKDSWPGSVWQVFCTNADEITTVNNEGRRPDWNLTARNSQGVALNQKKLEELLNGIVSTLTSRDACFFYQRAWSKVYTQRKGPI